MSKFIKNISIKLSKAQFNNFKTNDLKFEQNGDDFNFNFKFKSPLSVGDGCSEKINLVYNNIKNNTRIIYKTEIIENNKINDVFNEINDLKEIINKLNLKYKKTSREIKENVKKSTNLKLLKNKEEYINNIVNEYYFLINEKKQKIFDIVDFYNKNNIKETLSKFEICERTLFNYINGLKENNLKISPDNMEYFFNKHGIKKATFYRYLKHYQNIQNNKLKLKLKLKDDFYNN